MTALERKVGLALFCGRAFEFSIADDEVNELEGHIEFLVAAGHAIDVLAEYCDGAEVAPKHVKAAENGARFIASIASAMLERMKEARKVRP